jgi:hypothetical protein
LAPSSRIIFHRSVGRRGFSRASQCIMASFARTDFRIGETRRHSWFLKSHAQQHTKSTNESRRTAVAAAAFSMKWTLVRFLFYCTLNDVCAVSPSKSYSLSSSTSTELPRGRQTPTTQNLSGVSFGHLLMGCFTFDTWPG